MLVSLDRVYLSYWPHLLKFLTSVIWVFHVTNYLYFSRLSLRYVLGTPQAYFISLGLIFDAKRRAEPNHTYWAFWASHVGLCLFPQIEPVIQAEHESELHHIVLYNCYHNVSNETVGRGYECFSRNMPSDLWECTHIIAAWAVGGGVSKWTYNLSCVEFKNEVLDLYLYTFWMMKWSSLMGVKSVKPYLTSLI